MAQVDKNLTGRGWKKREWEVAVNEKRSGVIYGQPNTHLFVGFSVCTDVDEKPLLLAQFYVHASRYSLGCVQMDDGKLPLDTLIGAITVGTGTNPTEGDVEFLEEALTVKVAQSE